MTDSITDILGNYDVATLLEMGTAAGLPMKQGAKNLGKAATIKLLAKQYFTPERISRSYEQLSDHAKQVFQCALNQEGVFSTDIFRRQLERKRLIEPTPETKKPTVIFIVGPSYIGSPHRDTPYFEDLIAQIIYHGLLFNHPNMAHGSAKGKFSTHPAQYLLIPSLVREQLPAIAVFPDIEPTPPPVIRTPTPDSFLRELYLYWDFVRRNPIPLLKSQLVGKRHLKQLDQLLPISKVDWGMVREETDLPYLYLLRQTLVALQLVTVQKNSLVVSTMPPLEDSSFWHLSPVEMVSQCLSAQLSVEFPYEWSDTQQVRWRQPVLPEGRHYLLELIKQQPKQQWLEAEAILEMARGRKREFLFPYMTDLLNRKSLQRYDLNFYMYRSDSDSLVQELEKYEADLIAWLVGSTLFHLGLVELGYLDEAALAEGRWSLFRLTPLAAAAFHQTPLPPTIDDCRYILQPNFHLLAVGPVPISTLINIDRFAERQKLDTGIVEYQLTRESVYHAQQTSFTVTQIAAYLTELTSQPLPQNIRRTLEEWGTHHERIVFRSGLLLLHAAAAAQLTQLQNHNTFAPHIERRLTDHIAIGRGRGQTMIDALLQADILPAVSTLSPEAIHNTIHLDEEGHIQTIHPLPHFLLPQQLAPIAHETQPGHWQLAPDLIRQVGGTKEKALQLITQLNQLSRAPLSDSLLAKVKTWAGYYGMAAIETLTLVEFQDADILAELLANERLRPHLTPFNGTTRPLAIIAPDALPQVEAILKTLGISLPLSHK